MPLQDSSDQGQRLTICAYTHTHCAQGVGQCSVLLAS